MAGQQWLAKVLCPCFVRCRIHLEQFEASLTQLFNVFSLKLCYFAFYPDLCIIKIHKKIKTDLKKQYILQSYKSYYVLVGKQPPGL